MTMTTPTTATGTSSGGQTGTANPMYAGSAVAAEPQAKSFWQLFNISLAFLGIQFAWMIQMGQMSPLMEKLGASAWITSLIWCAGPITGIVVQPIVGSLSDKTWTFLGRRRPFLLVGAILAAICLIIMPNSPSLLVAAALAWILDASLNVSQGPYRALVPDVVPKQQQAFTYTLMGFTIGLGSVAASFIGFVIPDMHQLFYLGAVSIVVAILWTIVTTPESKREFSQDATQSGGFFAFIRQTWDSIIHMPPEVKKLCVMHSFTWYGWQCLFIFFSLFMAHKLFNATDSSSSAYKEAEHYVFLCYAVLNSVCFLVSPFIGKLCSGFSNKAVHTFGLLCFAAGLLSMPFLTEPFHAVIAMGVIGVGWATTLSVPFAILSHQVPAGREGVLMGTFNIFIALPQFIASSTVGPMVSLTHTEVTAMIMGGISVLCSAFLLQWVKD